MKRQYLINLRTQRNETQQDVADGIGVSRQYYSLIEDGSRQKRMDISLAAMLATYFKTPLASIVQLEQEWNAAESPEGG